MIQVEGGLRAHDPEISILELWTPVEGEHAPVAEVASSPVERAPGARRIPGVWSPGPAAAGGARLDRGHGPGLGCR